MIAINKVLCAVDFSDCSRHALEYAVAIGAYYEATVTALHVYDARPVVTSAPFGLEAMQVISVEDVSREAVAAAAARFVAQVPAASGVAVRVTEGPKVADEVTVQANLLAADLLVVGSHGRSGFERFLLGSTADRILRQSRHPVLVVPPHAGDRQGPAPMPFRRILCPVDFSDSSIRALEFARQLAEEADARLTLLHVIELPPELHELLPIDTGVQGVRLAAAQTCQARLDALVPESARVYCTIETQVVEGKAHQCILAAAAERDADLIVMGVLGRGAVDVAVFGSNTQSVLRGAQCPVLTIRA